MIKRSFKTVILLLAMSLCFSNFVRADSFVIGSKNFSEQVVLGELLAQLVEARTDIPVERKFFLGGASLAFEALKTGAIDVYPEYTGTAWMSILKKSSKGMSAQDVLKGVQKKLLKDYDLVWYDSLGFNNTYVLAYRKDDDRYQGVKNYSELTRISKNLIFGSPHEFLQRKDGLIGIESVYGIEFKKTVGMDPGLMYQALNSKGVDLITAFSTDGRLKKFGLKSLLDDRSFFPPYFASFVIRQDALKKWPALKNILKSLEGRISDSQMTEMNFLVESEGQTAKHVAYQFLISEGLVKGELKAASTETGLWNSWQVRKQEVWQRVLEHLYLVGLSLGISLIVALGLSILMLKNAVVKSVSLAVLSFFQTIPSLALLGLLIPFVGIGIVPALIVLFAYSLLPLVQNIYAGLNGIEEHYLDAAKGLGLTDFQVLRFVRFPMALPMIFAGIRLATINNIGLATIMALVGAGGLGELIFRGISSVNYDLIVLGSLPAAGLAILTDRFLATWEMIVRKKQGLEK